MSFLECGSCVCEMKEISFFRILFRNARGKVRLVYVLYRTHYHALRILISLFFLDFRIFVHTRLKLFDYNTGGDILPRCHCVVGGWMFARTNKPHYMYLHIKKVRIKIGELTCGIIKFNCCRFATFHLARCMLFGFWAWLDSHLVYVTVTLELQNGNKTSRKDVCNLNYFAS